MWDVMVSVVVVLGILLFCIVLLRVSFMGAYHGKTAAERRTPLGPGIPMLLFSLGSLWLIAYVVWTHWR